MVSDSESEPFDVMLEEALEPVDSVKPVEPVEVPVGSMPVQSPTRRRVVAAASVLLGVAVVLGVLMLNHRSAMDEANPGVMEAATQDPDRVVAVEAEQLAIDTALAVMPLVTGLRVVARGHGDVRAEALGELDLTEARWRRLVTPLPEGRQIRIEGSVPPEESARLWFMRGDGPPFEGTLFLRDTVGFVVFGGESVLLEGEVLAPWTELFVEAEKARRLALGVAHDLDELRLLPSTLSAVRCPCLSPEQVHSELMRFEGLERLAFAWSADDPLPGEGTIVALTRIRSLRALELPGRDLEDAALRRLRSLDLEQLVLTGVSTRVTAEGLASLPGLRKLGIRLDEASPALLDAVRRLPHLVELDLRGPWFDDRSIAALLSSKIAALGLYHTNATLSGLAQLRDLPSLRHLNLGGVMWLDPDSGRPVEGLEKVRAALPNCQVVDGLAPDTVVRR